MKRPTFNKNTRVKVINKSNDKYGQRGIVTQFGVTIGSSEMLDPDENKDAVKNAYDTGLEPKMAWHVRVKFTHPKDECWLGAIECQPVQHTFIDIEHIREEDIDLGMLKPDGTKAVRLKNTGAFEPGDLIQISTKIDGANASIAWDETTKKLEVFSRNTLLNESNTLRGFYQYIKAEVEPRVDWSKYPNLVIFGEWCVKHSITSYNKDWFNKWRVYDIWNTSANCYCTQNVVKGFCREHGLEYIEELYYGPFISWEHCKSFLDKSVKYGPEQEGIIIKNQTKLGNTLNIAPAYLKIVNDKFKESQLPKKERRAKHLDPEVSAAKSNADELMSTVVTEARVKKLVCKLIDEGVLPVEFTPKDMGTCMKSLPKRLFEDVCKEAPSVVEAAGEYAGKACSALAAKFAKALLLGK